MLTTKAAKKRFEQKLLANFFFSRLLRKFPNGVGTLGVQGCFPAASTVSRGLEIVFEIPQTYPHSPGSNSEPFTSQGESAQGRQRKEGLRGGCNRSLSVSLLA